MSKRSKKANASEAPKAFLKWTEVMDDVLIDALLNQQINGNRVDGIFTTTAYNNVLKECSEKLDISFEKDHLKNRMKTLKTNFNACYDLFKTMNGFSWSPVTKMWDAEPEVWNAFIKEKPKAKKWMTTPIHNYDRLLELFAKDRATGTAAESAKEKARRWAQEQSMGQFDSINNLDQMHLDKEVILENIGIGNSIIEPVTPSGEPSQSTTPQSTSSSRGKKRKAEMAKLFERQIEILNSGMENIAHAIREGNDAIREGNIIAERGRARVYSEDEVYAALGNIGVDQTFRMDAFLFLIDNVGWMRAFFGCPPEERKELLIRVMRSSQ